jgi:ABC-2 type transport system permease protein
MPIHDQGYRRYGGDKAPHGQAWTVIAKAGVRTMLGKRAFLGLLLLAWFPFVLRAIQIYASANFSQVSFLAPNVDMFHDFLEQQGFFIFVITVYVGAGLVANDRRANALQIYLSKPLTRTEYVFGKLTILMAFLLLVTWVPAIVLLVVQMAFAGNFSFLRANIYLFPAITVYSFVEAITIATVMLALSSLSKSARFVGILYTGLFFFTTALWGVLSFALGALHTRPGQGRPGVSWISLAADLTQVGNAIFRLPPKYDSPVIVSLAVIVALVIASGLVLERRVRGVEVVT